VLHSPSHIDFLYSNPVSSSSRFAIAVHVLAYLAIRGEGSALPSERIALSVNTNPTVVRRLLMQLAASGLTSSQLGTGGGAMLAREPESITLLEIYEAVDKLEVFPLHRSPPSPKCLVGRNITDVLREVSDSAEEAIRGELRGKRLSDIIKAVIRNEARRGDAIF
jgi:Rrf2 family protein